MPARLLTELTARQRAVAARGGNGFMAVAASHAALLLAQGAGRLLRRSDDRAGGPKDGDSAAIPLETAGRMRWVTPGQVRWVEAEGDYVRLYTTDGDAHLLPPLLVTLSFIAYQSGRAAESIEAAQEGASTGEPCSIATAQ